MSQLTADSGDERYSWPGHVSFAPQKSDKLTLVRKLIILQDDHSAPWAGSRCAELTTDARSHVATTYDTIVDEMAVSCISAFTQLTKRRDFAPALQWDTFAS